MLEGQPERQRRGRDKAYSERHTNVQREEG